MNRKPLKLLLIIIISIGCVGVGFLISQSKKFEASSPEGDFRVEQARHPLVIHGFKFSSCDQKGKNMAIKAVRLRIEKMKKAFLSIAPVRLAKFKDAEIDIYVQQIKSENDLRETSLKFNYSLKEMLTKKSLPDDGFENVLSLLFEPVKMNFYNGNSLLTQIQAKRASIKSKDGKVVFQGHVTATSNSRSLLTDRLTLFPDIGEMRTNNVFVFKTLEDKVTGNSITTDLILNPKSEILKNFVDGRKYGSEIHSKKSETDTLHPGHISDRLNFVQAASD